MKIAIMDKSVVDHTDGNVFGANRDCDALFVDDPLLTPRLEGILTANTCIGVRNLIVSEELRKNFEDFLGLDKKSPPISSLYSLFNGKDFSDFLEVHYSKHFLTGEVGPEVGFVTGVGLKVTDDIYQAIPQLNKLKSMLISMKYQGEVLLTVTKNYTLSNVNFGHYYGHFALYAECAKCSVQTLLDFVFGKGVPCELYDSCCIANLVSQQPFPTRINTSTGPINAPKGAEKHLWRIPIESGEIVLIVVHGNYLLEAKKRMRRTLENMRSYSDSIQYRIDYGNYCHFVLCQEKYEKLAAVSYHKNEQRKDSSEVASVKDTGSEEKKQEDSVE